MTVSCWKILQIDPTRDQRAIKKAYAVLLKQIDQQADARSFQQLREAYEQALNYVKYTDEDDDQEDNEDQVQTADEPTSAAPITPAAPDQYPAQALTMIASPRLAPQDIAVNDIFKRLGELGENIAIDKLKIHAALADFQSIDARTDLECALLKQFYQWEKLPLELAKAAALLFGWDSSKNPFKYNHQYAYFYEHVVNQIAYLGAVRHVLANCFPDPRQRDKTVEDVLFARFDQQRLSDIVANEAKRNTANRIINFMINDYKLFPALPVDPETVTWWRKNVYGENTEVVAPQPTKKKSGGSYWFIWIVIIVLFNALGKCAQTPSTKTYKTLPDKHQTNKEGQRGFIKEYEKNKQE